jgi:hypothetical protein
MIKRIRFEVKKNKDVSHETMQEALDNFDDVDEKNNEILEETFGHYSEEITGYYVDNLVEGAKKLSQDELEILRSEIGKIGKTEDELLYDEYKKLEKIHEQKTVDKKWFESFISIIELIAIITFSPLLLSILVMSFTFELVKEWQLILKIIVMKKKLFRMDSEKYFFLR